ncbi:MAG: membrane-bound serine protease (ClpP class) [Verrucomicrobiales bacterium]|jgi:membrane-bound serine protease (ClpP class)
MNPVKMKNQHFVARLLQLLVRLAWLGVFCLFAATMRAEVVTGKVVVIPVRDVTLTDSQELYQLGQVLEKVQREKASGIVLDLNVNRGDAAATATLVRERLAAIDIPVVAWANPSATGAGAVVALGSDTIAMAALGTLGGIDSGVQQLSRDDDEDSTERDTTPDTSALQAAVRAIAEAKGHDIKLAEAFVNPTAEIDGLVAKGTLLTLTASQAETAGIAKRVDTLEQAIALLEVENSEIVRVEGLRTFLRPSEQPAIPDADTDSMQVETDGEEPKPRGDGLFSRAEEESFAGKIVVIKIEETDELMLTSRFDWFERAIQKASDDGASAVILDMNTPGGRLWETQELMMSILAKAKCRTITYVNPNAISAGSMIAISTDAIYMAPAAVIGAATAVVGGGGEMSEAMQGKVSSVQIAAARNMATLKGHNPDIAEAFVSPEKVLRLGPVDDGPDKPLALNADQAVQLVNGKPLLAQGIALDVEEIIAQEGLKGEILRPEPYALEQFAMWVERLSAILIVIGIAGAYLEVKAPGFGVPGFVSMIAFGVFFFGNYMAGNLAGWEVAVVFVLGIILVLLELFVLPGTMIAGFIGIVLILGSLGFAMVDKVDFDLVRKGAETEIGWSALLLRPVLNLGIGLLLAGLLIMLAVTFLPQTRLMNWMVLDAKVGDRVAGGANSVAEVKQLLGKAGIAFTDLRPSGKASIDGQIVDVTSEVDFVEKGKQVKVVEQEGGRVVVEVV